MVETPHPMDAQLERYAADIVRWNRQINLVSRQQTERRVAELLTQCLAAGGVLLDDVLAGWDLGRPLAYFDLGSGGGLPGVVWHLQLADRGVPVSTTLVEPREKRAWFLARQAELAPTATLQVWRARWGEGGAPGSVQPLPATLISLKALHLPDPAVLRGLERAWRGHAAAAGSQIVIARFYPPEQTWTDDLASELGALWPCHETDDYIYRATGRRVAGPGPDGSASLVISGYEVSLRDR